MKQIIKMFLTENEANMYIDVLVDHINKKYNYTSKDIKFFIRLSDSYAEFGDLTADFDIFLVGFEIINNDIFVWIKLKDNINNFISELKAVIHLYERELDSKIND